MVLVDCPEAVGRAGAFAKRLQTVQTVIGSSGGDFSRAAGDQIAARRRAL